MEIKSTPWPRFAPWLVLLAAAFAAGRWHALGTRSQTSPQPLAAPASHSPGADRGKPATSSLDAIVDTARSSPQFDAAVEALAGATSADNVSAKFAQVRALPAAPQRDALLLQTARRWGELAPVAALAEVNTLENLPLRADARATVFEAWGRHDAAAAFAYASAEAGEGGRDRALPALLAGAAFSSAADAVALWERSPPLFRSSTAGDTALDRMAEAAIRAGQRAELQARIGGLPPDNERMRWATVLARHWGRYEPEAAVAWIKTIAPAGSPQDAMIDEVFSEFVRKDPARAAAWAARHADERRRSTYVAAAVAEWAAYDSASAETWVNEQEQGIYLDGATSAIAAHFIEHRLWPQAFAWTRRILRNEARADLLGNLGRIWNTERPDEFTTFLSQTSLNRAELEMLRSKIVEIASP
jgi:hypothetical protein